MKVPTFADKIFQAIKDNTPNAPRSHLGASIIGHSCDRWLWFSFRWIQREDFDGRMLRLFRRGQEEEAPLINDLRRAGLKIADIDPATRKQFNFKVGFFAGSMDGIILEGVPEAPNKQHILEIKTHSKKSFDALEKDGVEKSKPMHYAQMQVYMGAMQIDRALYVSVCKDDDRIYTERVRYVPEIFQKLTERAQRIITSDRMPEPLSADPTWFECKFCAAHPVCHKGKIPQDVSCRSCSHVTFERTGEVTCAHWETTVPFEHQVGGCECHIIHPDLVPWTMECTDEGKVFWVIDGQKVQNGEPDANVYSSRELLADPKACLSMREDKFAQDVRVEMGARICS